MDHWQILMGMLHKHLNSSGFLGLINSNSKQQPIVELIWTVICRQSARGTADIQAAMDRLAAAESAAEVLVAAAIMLAEDVSGLRPDGSSAEFIVEVCEKRNGEKGRSRSASKGSRDRKHKSEKKKKKGRDSRSRSNSRSSSKKNKNKDKKDKKNGRESHFDRDTSNKETQKTKKAFNIISLLLWKLLELPHLGHSDVFCLTLNYYSLEICLSQWLKLRHTTTDSDADHGEVQSLKQVESRVICFLNQVSATKERLSTTPLEKLCLNIILSKIATSRLLEDQIIPLNSSTLKLKVSQTWRAQLQLPDATHSSFNSLITIASAVQEGSFQKHHLGAILVFDQLNRYLEGVIDTEGFEVVDRMIASGWIDLLCFEVVKLNKTRKLDLEETDIIEAILAQLTFKSLYSLNNIKAVIEMLQREELMLSFGMLNHKEAKSVVDSLCKLINHTPQPLSLESVKVKKDAIKGKMLDYRELEFTQNAHEARFRVKKLFVSNKSEINLASLLLLLNKITCSFEPGSQYFGELVISKLFDALMKVIDIMTDLLWVCSYPEIACLEDTCKADLNPVHYLQISLKALYFCTGLFKEKLEFMGSVRPVPTEYLNVDLITLCSLVYLTAVKDNDSQILKMFKIEIDLNIEGIVTAAGKFESETSSKTDRVLNRLIELCLTSTNTVKSLTLLKLYLSARNKPFSTSVVDTLLCTPGSLTKVPLRTLCSERSPLYLFDYSVDYKDESILQRLLVFVLGIADLDCQLALRDALQQLVKRANSRLFEGLYKVIEKIARDRLTRSQEDEDSLARSVWYTNFYGVLNTLARNHVWKSIAVEGDLGDLMLNSLEKQVPAGWLDSDSVEASANCFCLFLNFAEILIDKRFGMSNQLGDYKEAKDGSHIEYLFEDLPKESLIQDILRKIESFIQPIIGQFHSVKDSSSRECLEQSILSWTRFLNSITRSTICQIMLLYGLYTKQVKSAGSPLINLRPLVDLLRELRSPLGLQAASELMASVCNLIIGGEDDRPLRSDRRLRAIDKLLGSDTLALTSQLSSLPLDSTWHLLVSLQASRAKSAAEQCSPDNDREENVSYLNSRDFNEIFKRFSKFNEEDQKDALKKLPKKKASSAEFSDIMSCIAYQINEEASDCLLFEDIEARKWHNDFVDDLRNENKNQNRKNRSIVSPQNFQEIQLQPSRKENTSRILDEAIDSKSKMSFGVFKDVIFQNTHRFVESKTYNPEPEQPRLTPHNSNSHPNTSTSGMLNPRISSTRAASTHVDNFRGVNSQSAGPPPDKLNMSPPSRTDISPSVRPPPPPSPHAQPSLPSPAPTHPIHPLPTPFDPTAQAHQPLTHAATHYPPHPLHHPQPHYMPPTAADYNPFSQPTINAFGHSGDNRMNKGEVQQVLALLKLKHMQRK